MSEPSDDVLLEFCAKVLDMEIACRMNSTLWTGRGFIEPLTNLGAAFRVAMACNCVASISTNSFVSVNTTAGQILAYVLHDGTEASAARALVIALYRASGESHE